MKISDRIREIANQSWDDGCERELHSIADELDAAEKPKWFWGRPDKVGLYAAGGTDKDGPLIDWRVMKLTADPSLVVVAWYAYIGPIPTIDPPEKPKKYDTPILPRDAGKQCEFSDDGFKTIVVGDLHGFVNCVKKTWVESESYFTYADCRIEVTE